MPRAKIFIASATESLPTATAVHRHLSAETDSEIWTTGFESGNYLIPSLLDKANGSDFAVFIFDPVDVTKRPDGRVSGSVRDNVLFECGMFFRALGSERVFLLVPQEVNLTSLPSDLRGLLVQPYPRTHSDPAAAVHTACSIILRRVREWQNAPARSEAAYRRYLRVASTTSGRQLLTIAHCAREKWSRGALLTAPGDTLGRHIVDGMALEIGPEALARIQLDDPTTPPRIPDWDRPEIRDAETIFLIDSPYFNEYLREVLDGYQRRMIGGCVRYATDPWNRIMVGGKLLESDKHPDFNGRLFGAFKDYVLVMKLPGSVASSTKVRAHSVWLVYGLTTKGSHAAAHLFRQDNFRKFAEQLERDKHAPLPEYFEVVFEIPKFPGRVESFDQMTIAHFAALKEGREYFAGDPLPLAPWRYVETHNRAAVPPLCSVHLDLYAGCNYTCEGCIEARTRKKNSYLAMDKVVRILLDLRRLGCRDIRFYGGEPTLHPQFANVVELADSMGFQMMLVTNGSKLGNDAIVDALAGAKSMRVRVSLDAHSAEVHADHHGCSLDQFETIRKAIRSLLGKKVPVNISYLLTDKSSASFEDACCYWHEAGAEAFLPRIPMGPGGRWDSRRAYRSLDLASALSNVERDYGSWLVVEEWVRNWILNGFPVRRGAGGTDISRWRPVRCHSGLFRLVVSPWVSEDADSPGPTDRAWISLCPYHRYEERFGCLYPEDPQTLGTWWIGGRLDRLETLPMDLCVDTFCSRTEMHSVLESSGEV